MTQSLSALVAPEFLGFEARPSEGITMNWGNLE